MEITSRVDDLDGGEKQVSEHRFSIDGIDYAVDLSDDNWADFLEKIDYIRCRARVAKKGRSSRTPELTKDQRRELRAWAERTGRPLSDRGRLPNALIEEWLASRTIHERGNALAGV